MALRLDDNLFEKVSGGVGFDENGGGLPEEGLKIFISTCKNSWGLDLDGALENLRRDWATYSAEWGKGGIVPVLETCEEYVRANWDKIA